MTRPRCLVPGQTYLVTRRCSERRFFLRPDGEVNNILMYCLSRAAERYELAIHAFAFLGNHYHLVLSDHSDEVRLPRFMAWLNLHTARLINPLRQRRENMWAPGSYNAVVLADEASVIDKIVYTLCNPVAAGLVSHPGLWPGNLSLPGTLTGQPFKARHPGALFRKDQAEQTTLRLSQPPGLKGMSAKKYRKLIADRVKKRVADIRLARGRDAFLGRKAIERQDPHGRPQSAEPAEKLKPCLACKDKARRVRILRGLKLYHQNYRQALDAWRSGDREVEFPAGTYGMDRFHSAKCRSGPGVFALE